MIVTKNIIELNSEELVVLKRICKINKRKTTAQSAVDVATEIAVSVIKFLDKEDFKQVTNLNK